MSCRTLICPPNTGHQYWGYCYMKYSYEYKLYRQGKWPETPEGLQKRAFHVMIRKWVRMEDSCGPEALQHKNQNKEWTAEQRYELVARVLAGSSVKETAFSAGIDSGQLHQWVKRYKIEGYQGLTTLRKGRPPKEPQMKKKIEPAELTPSKREEKWAAQLKARKQRSSKDSVKKDIP